jgi:ubiquinone/menaquinone biosynthesis C-methylase UbiE
MAERAHPQDPGFQDRWFGLVRNKYKRKLIERYRFCLPFIGKKSVLDIPCGTGWGTSFLSHAAGVVGIDRSPEAIAYASKKYAKPGRTFLLGDMAAIPVEDSSFDVVICLEGFEHVDRNVGALFLSEARRILKPSGIVIMTCPVLNEQGLSTGNPYHLSEYPEAELRQLLTRDFRVIRMEKIRGPDGPECRAVLSVSKPSL